MINGVQQPTDGGYTLTGQGATGGGNLTFTLGQTAGAIITLFRDIPISRVTQLSQNGTFFSANFNNEYNRLYLIAQQLQQSIGQCLQVPNTNNPAPVTTLLPANYANKYLSFDANGNPTPALLTSSGALTQALIAGLYQPQTPLVAAAGVTPVNFQYAVGCVDRYKTNATPGTTSMTSAFQAAVNIARKGGPDVTWGATAPYNLDNTIDCTFGTTAQQYGITFRQIGTPGVNLPTSTAGGLLITHNKYTCFDLTGCAFFAFYDLTAVTNSSNYPQTMFLTARSVGAGGESNFPRFFNTKVVGYFSVGILYNYGSEDGLYVGNIWENYATDAGASVVVITVTNLWQGNAAFMSSAFVTIETGPQSCIGHTFTSGDYALLNASTTSDVFYIEGAVTNFRLSDGWVCNSNSSTHGRAMIYNDTTNGAAISPIVRGIHCEVSTTVPLYFMYASANVSNAIQWALEDCYVDVNTQAIKLDTGVTGINMRVLGLQELNTKGINVVGTLEDSDITYNGTITVGNSTKNTYLALNANVTRSVHTDDYLVDTATGSVYVDGNVATTSGVYEVAGTQVVGAQQTTSVAAATFSQVDTTTAVSTDSTFDGYTLKQVVKALRIHGLLA